MTDGFLRATGEVVAGHRVASGAGGDPRFPRGTIVPQLPFLRAAIPGFDAHLGAPPFPGTINLRFDGRTVTILRPELRVPAVRWTEQFPPENFLLSRCRLERRGVALPAFLYIPDPATKPDHYQPGSVVELLCGLVAGLAYGETVELLYAPAAISID